MWPKFMVDYLRSGSIRILCLSHWIQMYEKHTYTISVLTMKYFTLCCRPSALASFSQSNWISARCLSAGSLAESYACWVFLGCPRGYVIIASNQTPEGFNLDYVREVVTENCKEVNSVCLICLLQVCPLRNYCANHIHTVTKIEHNSGTNGYSSKHKIILKMYALY